MTKSSGADVDLVEKNRRIEKNVRDCESLAESYLEHILLFISSNNPDNHLFRNFIDSWFAYHKKGPFLNSNQRPRWFNNPSPVKDRPALLNMHFVSAAAFQIIETKSDTRLIKEHSIPVSILLALLSAAKPRKLSDVENFLLRYYRLGVITKEEDNRISRLGYKSKMPTGWSKGCSVLERYEVAGIASASLESSTN